jgi:glycosyltransferase involved in cell wall biosynthesis
VKLRILHVITRLPVGGAEKVLIDIVRNLDPARYESVVCCIQDRGELAAEIEKMQVPLVCLHRMQSKRFDFRAVIALKSLIRKERIGLVHSHLYHANLYGRLAALLAGVPAIATVHNTYTRTKLHRRLLNYGLSRASARVIAVSEEIRSDLLRYDGIDARKVTLIPNGIDVRRLDTSIGRDEARKRLGISDDAIVVGCVGRLEEQKGHRFLLEAVALLRRDGTFAPRLLIIVVGDGRLRKELEERAIALGVAPWTSFLGMRQDIAEILKALDIYVMPSLWEGLSIAMLEAMAAALPLVVTDVGGVSQVAADCHCVVKVPPGDAPALREALRLLIEDPDRRSALAASARRRVLAKFSNEAMMRELTRVYEQSA